MRSFAVEESASALFKPVGRMFLFYSYYFVPSFTRSMFISLLVLMHLLALFHTYVGKSCRLVILFCNPTRTFMTPGQVILVNRMKALMNLDIWIKEMIMGGEKLKSNKQ